MAGAVEPRLKAAAVPILKTTAPYRPRALRVHPPFASYYRN
jgi:hypothetical protein